MVKLYFEKACKSRLTLLLCAIIILCSGHDALAQESPNPATVVKTAIAEADSIKKQAQTVNLQTGTKKELAELTGTLKKLKPEKPGKKISFDLAAEAKTRYGAQSPVTGMPSLLNNFTLSGGVAVFNVPLQAEYAINSNLGNTFRGTDNLFRFNFDKEKYTNLGKSSIERFTSIRSKFSGMNIGDFTQRKISEKLGQLKTKGNEVKNNGLKTYLAKKENIEELLTWDEQQVKEKLEQAAKSGNNKPTAKPDGASQKAIIKAAEQQENAVKTQVDSIANVITRIKKVLADNQVKLSSLLAAEKAVTEGGFSPESISNLIPQGTQQHGFLKNIFSSINDFKTGSFGEHIPGSQLSPDVFIQGFRISLSRSLAGLSLGYGRVSELGFQKDAGFTNSIYSAAKDLTSISVKTNSSRFMNGRLSWINSLSSGSSSGPLNSGSIARNSMALTFSQAVNLGNGGNLSLDVSKSSSQYRNTLSPGVEQIMENRNSLGYYFRDESFQTMSVGLNHSMASKKLGVTDNFYVSYAGTGYQNPAANGFGMAKKRIGGSLKKTLYKNKLAFNIRTDLQSMPLGGEGTGQWQNYQFQFDSRYQVGKKVNVSLKYLSNGSDKITDTRTSLYSSQKFQFDGNASYQLGPWFANSHLSVGNQNLSNKYQSAISSNLMMVNYSQVVVLGENTLSGSLFYNKELSAYKLIGNMLNSDLTLQYSLFDKVSTSTGITYLNNQDIARQAGFRQDIQFMASKSVDLSLFIDVRKNLVQPLYPDLYSACRADFSVKYYFNTKQAK